MTLFEYLAIAYSLVVSFTVLRALSGLPHAAAPGRVYWVHLAWVCVILGAAFQFYWGFWAYRDIEWTQPLFLLSLSNPALLYVMACLLTPEISSTVDSWREYFFSVRLRLFLVGLCFQVVSLTTLLVVIEIDLNDPVLVGQVAMLPIWIIGLASSRPVVHSAIVAVTLAILVYGAFTFLATVS